LERDGELEHGGDSVEASVEAISSRFTPAAVKRLSPPDLEDAEVLSVAADVVPGVSIPHPPVPPPSGYELPPA
jgi:hypothetical protein